MNEQRKQANNFRLEGGGLEVTYSLPSGWLVMPGGEFGDRRLQVEPYPLAIGTFVHFTLQSIPDGNETSLSLLLPVVNLPQDVDEVAVTAFAIVTTHRSSIGGPDLVDGQLQTYDVRALKGTAYFAHEGAAV